MTTSFSNPTNRLLDPRARDARPEPERPRALLRRGPGHRRRQHVDPGRPRRPARLRALPARSEVNGHVNSADAPLVGVPVTPAQPRPPGRGDHLPIGGQRHQPRHHPIGGWADRAPTCHGGRCRVVHHPTRHDVAAGRQDAGGRAAAARAAAVSPRNG